MSLQVDLTQREIRIANNIVNGSQTWDDLPAEDKLSLYECPADLDGIVPNEKIDQFENQLALKGYFGPSGMAKAAINKTRGITE